MPRVCHTTENMVRIPLGQPVQCQEDGADYEIEAERVEWTPDESGGHG
jgi:hypothetical protein